MNRQTLAALSAAMASMAASSALAHDTFTSMYAPAGYAQDLEMRVTHGCKGSPVKEVKIKIPDGVTRVQVQNVRDWKYETKMRKLDKPVMGEGGNMITETVDEITWKNPPSPMPASGVYEGFRFRAHLPDTPGAILFFRTVNVCEKGDDRYVDLPTETLTASTPGLPERLLKFMTATPTPAPFLILEKPARPQYPFAMPTAPKPAGGTAPAKRG